jgi:hypothetical protein
VWFVMGELFGGEENVGLRADGRRVGAAEMLPRSLRYVLAKGASTPVPSKLRASGMTGGFDVGAAIEEAGAWLKPGTYMRLRWGACTTQTVVLGGLFGVADLLHYGLD